MTNFLPNGSVTGIGSLPHTDPAAAIRFVAEMSPTIPFWPQLLKRSPQEDMLLQALVPLADLLEVHGPGQIYLKTAQVELFRRRLYSVSARLDEAHATGFFALERALFAGEFTSARLLKGQLYGPLTLARCIYYQGYPICRRPGIYAALTDYLCRLARWQVGHLRRFGKPVLLVVDEPALALEAPDAPVLSYLRQVLQGIEEAGAYSGVHCCALVQPATLANTAAQFLSFDAHNQLEEFLTHRSIQDFVATGGWLGLGLIPTLIDTSHLVPEDIFARVVGAAVAGHYDLDQLAAQSLITATCGLGLLPEASAQPSFAKAQQLARCLGQPEGVGCQPR